MISDADFEALVQDRMERYKWTAAIVKEMNAELGEGKAMEIASKALTKLQEELGRELAVKYGATFQGLCQWLHDAAEETGLLTITEEDERHICTNLPRCPSWEALSRLGVPELCRVYCATDPALTRAFSPDVTHEVTHKCSKGDDYCDNSWRL